MKTEYSSTLELDRTVLHFVNMFRGSENTINRWALVERVFGFEAAAQPVRNNNNIWDRQVRESVERLRESGQHICNLGEGYFMAISRDEYQKFKASYLSAAYRKMEIASKMDETADQRWGKQTRQADPMQAVLFGGV